MSAAQADRDSRYDEKGTGVELRSESGPGGKGSAFVVTLPERGLEGAWPGS